MYSFYRKVHTFSLNILASEAVRIRCLWPACYIRRPCLKIQKGKGSLNIHLLHRWGAVMILLLCSSTSHECTVVKKKLKLKETRRSYCRKRSTTASETISPFSHWWGGTGFPLGIPWSHFKSWPLAADNTPRQVSLALRFGKSGLHLGESVILNTSKISK